MWQMYINQGLMSGGCCNIKTNQYDTPAVSEKMSNAFLKTFLSRFVHRLVGLHKHRECLGFDFNRCIAVECQSTAACDPQ